MLKIRRSWRIVCAAFVVLFSSTVRAHNDLYSDGKSEYRIIIPEKPSDCERLAAEELAKYFKMMTAAALPIQTGGSAEHSLTICEKSHLSSLGIKPGAVLSKVEEDGFALVPSDSHMLIVGGRGRATLTGTYRFLEALGCRFLSPQFDHYKGSAEAIPKLTDVDQPALLAANPALKFRKLYVEEGHSHNIENLKQLAEWMPKAGYNTLVIPTNYQGRGKVKWDNWRKDLTPELQKRDITIEVGGHGYQNFIGGDMKDPSGDGTLFQKHPDWFPVDAKGMRHNGHSWVFNTANEDAVAFMVGNVTAYLRDRPEIQIFDLWPPDADHWDESEAGKKLGTPSDRMVLLTNRVAAEVKKVRPDVRLECIAYSHFTPAPTTKLDPAVLVDYCPINQNFTVPINDPSAPTNATYVTNLLGWRKAFGGDISIYSYYRKYAWQSLPVLLPHYIQADLKFYATVPTQGISEYSEPGDWFTYELNHYVLARLAWDAEADVDALVKEFCSARYGSAAPAAIETVSLLEKLVRTRCSLPFTPRGSQEELAKASNEIKAAQAKLEEAAKKSDDAVKYNLTRLEYCCEYAWRDIELIRSRVAKGSEEEFSKQVGELETFINSHANDGVFVVEGKRLGHQQLIDRYSHPR